MRYFLFQVIYSKNQKTIAMIQSHHRILSIDSSHCVIWFIELFFPDFVIASPKIRWRKDVKYCLSVSYKMHGFWVTKSGKAVRSYYQEKTNRLVYSFLVNLSAVEQVGNLLNLNPLYLQVGIFSRIPIFEYALNSAVFLIITIFAFVKRIVFVQPMLCLCGLYIGI